MAESFLPPVVAVLTANISEFKAKMAEAKTEMEGAQSTAGRMGALGKTALLGLAAGAVAVGAESVKMASNFQATMELIATQAHAGQQEVDAMSKAVLDLAPTVGIGPEKLAEGLYHVESTGLRGKDALDVLTASAREAAMGMADFDSVTYAMSGVMSAAMRDVKDAADGVAYLNTIVGTGDMRMQDLANAIGTGVLPTFKTAGLGMRDFGSALAVLTDNSMPAEVAANHLKTAVQLLQNQSGPAQKALAELGIKAGELSADLKKPDGLLVAVEDLKTHVDEAAKHGKDAGALLSKAFGGARSASTVMELVDELDKLKSKYDAMGTVATRARQQEEDWANTQSTFRQKMKDLGAQFQTWAIDVGQVLLPVLSKLADWFLGSVHWIGDHHAALAALAGAALPLVTMGVWALVSAVWAFTAALLANPITWVVAAFALLGVAIYELITHWDKVKEVTQKVWQAIKDWIHARIEDVKTKIHEIGEIPGKVADWFQQTKDAAVRKWNELVDWVRGIPGRISDALGNLGHVLWDAGVSIIKGFLDGLKAKFQDVMSFVGGIGDWIAAHKGPIDYDRTLLTPHGHAIMSGLLSGLQEGGAQVQDYLDDFTGSIGALGTGGTLTVTGGLAGPVATAGAGGPAVQVVNVTVQVQGSLVHQSDLRRVIQDLFLQHNLRNASNGLSVGLV